MPTLEDFGFTLEEIEQYNSEKRADINLKGGEDAALERVKHYVFDSRALKNYKFTRN